MASEAFKIFGSIFLDDSKTNNSLNKLSKAWDKNISQIGQGMSQIGKGFQIASGVIIGAGAVVANQFINFEDGLAKIGTLVDTNTVDMEKMGNSIVEVSNKYGTATGTIQEAVYQALSAGVDVGDVMGYVDSQLALAKAGFSDVATVTDLTTTIMNSYGMEMKDITKINDTLIQVQNKGKTTVGELASNMGKAIPTANSLGVNLDNLGAAMAQMTVNGVSTAESTTYVNSMLTELGKSGSKASDIVKELSGKSFKELMDSGKSVGDVLAMMDEYAKDSELSLSDLFGSAEAGRAALILSKNAGKDFNAMLNDMQNSAGSTESALEKVQNTAGEKLRNSLNELKNTGLKFGEALVPVIENVTKWIGNLAGKIGALNDEQIDMMLKGAGVVLAIGGISGAISVATTVITPFVSVIGGIVKLLGLLSPTGLVVAGVAAGIALISGAIMLLKDEFTGLDEGINETNGQFVIFSSEVEARNQEILTSFGELSTNAREELNKIWDVNINDENSQTFLAAVQARYDEYLRIAQETVTQETEIVKKGLADNIFYNSEQGQQLLQDIQNYSEQEKEAYTTKYKEINNIVATAAAENRTFTTDEFQKMRQLQDEMTAIELNQIRGTNDQKMASQLEFQTKSAQEQRGYIDQLAIANEEAFINEMETYSNRRNENLAIIDDMYNKGIIKSEDAYRRMVNNEIKNHDESIANAKEYYSNRLSDMESAYDLEEGTLERAYNALQTVEDMHLQTVNKNVDKYVEAVNRKGNSDKYYTQDQKTLLDQSERYLQTNRFAFETWADKAKNSNDRVSGAVKDTTKNIKDMPNSKNIDFNTNADSQSSKVRDLKNEIDNIATYKSIYFDASISPTLAEMKYGKYHDGAIFKSPTLIGNSLVGDTRLAGNANGNPEVVAPLDELKDLLFNNGGEGSQTINVYLDGKKIFSQAADAIGSSLGVRNRNLGWGGA